MKSSNFGYIPALDHLRGFAALLVLFFHGSHFIFHKIEYGTPYDPANWPLAQNPFSALVIEGHTAVSLFFVLSGFVFTVGSLEKRLRFVGFFRNRFLRTYPLFLFVLALGVFFFRENFNVLGILQSILFLANSETAFNGGAFTFVFWSIAVEWHFYLLFPLLILGVKRYDWKLIPLLIIGFLALRTGLYFAGTDMRDVSYWSILGRIDQFLLGMLAGIFYCRKYQQGRVMDWVGVAGLVGVPFLLMGFNHLGGGGVNNYLWIFWPTIEATAWAVFLLGYLSLARHYNRQVGKMLVALGAVSYSIYLLHYVVLDFFMQRDWDTVILLGNALGTGVLNTAIFVMPPVIMVSALTYWGIERPFLRRRQKYVKSS